MKMMKKPKWIVIPHYDDDELFVVRVTTGRFKDLVLQFNGVKFLEQPSGKTVATVDYDVLTLPSKKRIKRRLLNRNNREMKKLNKCVTIIIDGLLSSEMSFEEQTLEQ